MNMDTGDKSTEGQEVEAVHLNFLHENFDDRQLKEIAFSRYYAKHYAHGTDGHNAKLIIAQLADLVDQLELQLAVVKIQLAVQQNG